MRVKRDMRKFISLVLGLVLFIGLIAPATADNGAQSRNRFETNEETGSTYLIEATNRLTFTDALGVPVPDVSYAADGSTFFIASDNMSSGQRSTRFDRVQRDLARNSYVTLAPYGAYFAGRLFSTFEGGAGRTLIRPEIWDSSNPSVVEAVSPAVLGRVHFEVRGPGTAVIGHVVLPTRGNNGRVNTVTVTVAPADRTVVTASPGRVIVHVPVLLSQGEIRSLMEYASDHTETRSAAPHPSRRMTDAELEAWIENYQRLGINAQELETLYWMNYERMGQRNIRRPFMLCPKLSMASRLHSQLTSEGHTGWARWIETRDPSYAHADNFYGRPGDRVRLFGRNSAAENMHSIDDPRQVVIGWMNSPGHRRNLLSEREYVGVGREGRFTTMKPARAS